MSSQIHPAAIIEDGVTIGENCDIRAGAILRRGVELGDRVTVHSYAVIGGEPQDIHFDPATETGVRIGSGTTLREYVTINRATKPGQRTIVGENCFLMAASHVAHDCVLGDNVILANAVLLAGHTQVGRYCFIGGASAVHQFSRIGEGAILGGVSRISMDMPPFVMGAERNVVVGFNLIGMRRRGVPRESVAELKRLFHAVYETPGNIRKIAADLLPEAKTPEGRLFLQFFNEGKRSIARPEHGAHLDEAEE